MWKLTDIQYIVNIVFPSNFIWTNSFWLNVNVNAAHRFELGALRLSGLAYWLHAVQHIYVDILRRHVHITFGFCIEFTTVWKIARCSIEYRLFVLWIYSGDNLCVVNIQESEFANWVHMYVCMSRCVLFYLTCEESISIKYSLYKTATLVIVLK